jgi:hypothetical protein
VPSPAARGEDARDLGRGVARTAVELDDGLSVGVLDVAVDRAVGRGADLTPGGWQPVRPLDVDEVAVLEC